MTDDRVQNNHEVHGLFLLRNQRGGRIAETDKTVLRIEREEGYRDRRH